MRLQTNPLEVFELQTLLSAANYDSCPLLLLISVQTLSTPNTRGPLRHVMSKFVGSCSLHGLTHMSICACGGQWQVSGSDSRAVCHSHSFKFDHILGVLCSIRLGYLKRCEDDIL
jgi:hypothetical protein